MAVSKIKIYPSITTHETDWEKQFIEIKDRSINEFCLFLTAADYTERKKIYKAISSIKIKKIPLVHLRSDMDISEIAMLVKKFKVEKFNFHPNASRPIIHDYKQYKKRIYLENVDVVPKESELKKYAGICLDFSHWESAIRQKSVVYDNFNKLIKKYKTGCAHISGISKTLCTAPAVVGFSDHRPSNLKQMDYLKKYKKYFPAVCAIELKNSISDQLKIIDYINKLLKI